MNNRWKSDLKYYWNNFWYIVLNVMKNIFTGVFLIAVITIPLWTEYIRYNCDETNISLLVDGKEVYTGKGHFIRIDSIGENGNTKKVKIYKDIIKIHISNLYVSDNVKVINKGE